MPFKPLNDNELSDNTELLPENAMQTAIESGYNPDPSIIDVVKSAFTTNNSLGILVTNLSQDKPVPAEGYDPLTTNADDIKGFEWAIDDFAFSQSPEETQMIKSRIISDLRKKQMVSESGLTGFIADMAAGMTDPVYLPFMTSGVSLWGSGAKSAIRTAGRTAVIGAVSETAAEGLKQYLQPGRTLTESLVNIGAATFLSGVIGGGVHGVSNQLKKRSVQKFMDDMGSDTPNFHVNDARTIEGLPRVWDLDEGIVLKTEPDINVPFRTDRPTLKELPDSVYDPAPAGGLESWGVSPQTRLSVSKSRTAKEVLYELSEVGFVTQGNLKGISMTPEIGAVETLIKSHDAKLAFSRLELRNQYTDYKKTYKLNIKSLSPDQRAIAPPLMSQKEFRESIGYAMIRGDVHQIPQVQNMAKYLRDNVFDPLKNEAIQLGIFKEDVAPETAVSYLTRMYNHQKIIAQRNKPGGWNDRLRNWIMDERLKSRQKIPELMKNVEGITGQPVKLTGDLEKDIAQALRQVEGRRFQAEESFKNVSQSVENLKTRIKDGIADREKIKTKMKPVESALTELRSELQTSIKRFMKFRPDPKVKEIHAQISKLNSKLDNLEKSIHGHKEAETELERQAAKEINKFFKSREKGDALRSKEQIKTFENIERRLKEIRKRIAGKEGQRENIITDIKKITDDSKWRNTGDASRAKELSVSIERLQKKIKPKAQKLDDMGRGLDDALENLKNLRERLSTGFEARDFKYQERTTARWIERRLKKHELAFLHDDFIQDVIDNITDNILGQSVGRMDFDIKTVTRGPMKERVLRIPDEFIEDYLEKDVDIIMDYYIKTMAPDIELVKRFGSTTLDDQLKRVNDEYNDLINAATSEKQSTRLTNEKKQVLEDIKALVDKNRGIYKMPQNPDHWFTRTLRATKSVNFLRMLGGMTLSAIPDPAMIIAANGLKQFGKGFLALALTPKTFNLIREQAKRWAIGLDMMLNSRAMSMAELSDHYARKTALERGLDSMSNLYSKVTLMAQWNSAWKQFAGVVTSDRILNESVNWATGTITKQAKARLAHAGIDENLARRIAKEFTSFGDDGLLKIANADQWGDLKAYTAFKNAVLKNVDAQIVTPGKGENPLIFESELGKTVFQFKSFAASTHHKILLSNLQFRDAGAATGFLTAVALGSLAMGLKNYVADRPIPDDPTQIILDSLDRSGMFGYFWDINNISSKIFRGVLSIEGALGADPLSRYASRGVFGALFGPSVGTVEETATVAGSLFAGDFKKSDLHLVRKLLPFQNLFYIRTLLNSLEKQVGKGLKK